jgi:hypothetical protein
MTVLASLEVAIAVLYRRRNLLPPWIPKASHTAAMDFPPAVKTDEQADDSRSPLKSLHQILSPGDDRD